MRLFGRDMDVRAVGFRAGGGRAVEVRLLVEGDAMDRTELGRIGMADMRRTFICSRLEDQLLAQAYEQLVPTPRRVIGFNGPQES